MTFDELYEAYKASTGKFAIPGDAVDTFGRMTVTVPADILEGINLGGMFAQNLNGQEVKAKFQSALSKTIEYARETKASKTATLPFRLNTYGLQFAELAITPTSSGNLLISVTPNTQNAAVDIESRMAKEAEAPITEE